MSYFKTGGRYNPSTNTWTATSTTGAPARNSHVAVWTGTEMIVGGDMVALISTPVDATTPRQNTWTATSTIGAPAARAYHTAVWTGTE